MLVASEILYLGHSLGRRRTRALMKLMCTLVRKRRTRLSSGHELVTEGIFLDRLG